MQYLEIIGGSKLRGEVRIGGAKNSALPLLATTILSKNDIKFENLPNVTDINTMLRLLKNLGAVFKYFNDTLNINCKNINRTIATYDIVKTMRASILVLGPLLSRFKSCQVSLPGGCAIGQRPVDLHLKALKQMGADIKIKNGYIDAHAKNGLKGATIIFDKITVTGTENIIMAAALAKGKTTIINSAKEPEVVQLCEVLKDAGIKIDGIGTNTIEIVGNNGELLDIKNTKIIPDRIEAGTYLVAGAITNSKITISNIIPLHLEAVLAKFKEIGFDYIKNNNSITLLPAKKLKPIQITTTEYPGFPTDMQAQFMALLSTIEGVSIIDERLFENRFMHVSELNRMGADITLNKTVATINGVKELNGADVMATDLRASSALVLAGLRAKGITKIDRIYHLDRGYIQLEKKLLDIGANIKRIDTKKFGHF